MKTCGCSVKKSSRRWRSIVTDILKPVWPLLEATDPTITPVGWRRLPSATRQALESSGLAKPAGFANRIPCPVCTSHHIESVIERKAGDGTASYFIRCAREMRVDVYDRDRQVWRLDARAIAESIAESASLNGVIRALAGDRLFHLGHHAFRGIRTEVYLGRGLTRRDAVAVIKSLPKGVVPPIVLVPMSAPSPDVWAEMPARVFTLDACHTFLDGRLGIDVRLIEAAVRRYLQGDFSPDYLFHCKGNFWEVAFNGSEVKHLKDTKGMRYIARLLWEPDRAITAVDLLAAEAGIDPRLAQGTSGEELDDRGRREMRELYKGLLEQRAKAEKANDETARAVAQAEIDVVEPELLRRLAKDGKPRENTDLERVRKSVSIALRRGIDQCQKHLPELWKHLTTNVNTGNTLKYAPEQPIDWILD